MDADFGDRDDSKTLKRKRKVHPIAELERAEERDMRSRRR
jgi:hypothetical protein